MPTIDIIIIYHWCQQAMQWLLHLICGSYASSLPLYTVEPTDIRNLDSASIV
jgi:hypothetical protein